MCPWRCSSTWIESSAVPTSPCAPASASVRASRWPALRATWTAWSSAPPWWRSWSEARMWEHSSSRCARYESMKRVFRAASLIQVAHARNLLLTVGIESELRNQYLAGALGDLPMLETWPQLYVESGEEPRPPRGVGPPGSSADRRFLDRQILR